MKKKVCTILSIVMVTATILTGCGQITGTCDMCKKEAKLWKLSVIDKDDSSNNATQILCEDCLEDAKELWDKMINLGFDYISYSEEKYTGK